MPNAPDTFESLPIDADRLCEGISKIGYLPWAALMDIGDNSVTAGARNVRITLDLRPDASLGTKGGVLAFRIWDDGSGMTDSQVRKALQLGSQGEYPPQSLSKFGLGLKSAGFSLGDRISVLSKHDGLLSHLWTLDRDVIRERGMYGTFSEDPPAELAELLDDVPSGTVIEITKLLPRQHSANRIRRDLVERLGVTYYEFLSRAVDPLKVTLHYGSKIETIEAVDFLFLADAKPSFDPDDYDCKSPVRTLTRELDNPLDPSGPKMKLEIAFFPQASMASFAAFSEAERARIKEYRVNRDTNGFFFYRNGRLLVWGDHLAGVTRNDITFRARLSFTDAHDELLHVDVSKQHLMVPEEIEEMLKTLARIPLAQARQASLLCTKLTREGIGVEGEEFNRLTEVFEEEDPDEDTGATPPAETRRKRRAALEEASKAVDSELDPGATDAGDNGESASETVEPSEPTFERVRYSTGITGSNIAVPGYDTVFDTYVRVNKNHPFYQLILNPLPPADKLRLAIEGLLFAAAIAENKTIQNTPASIEIDALQAIFEKYRRVLGQNLEAWLSARQDLFG